MRSAALACLVTAYKVGSDDAWRHLGRLSDSLRDALEEKFAKAAGDGEEERGPPGDGPGASKPAVPDVAMASAVFRRAGHGLHGVVGAPRSAATRDAGPFGGGGRRRRSPRAGGTAADGGSSGWLDPIARHRRERRRRGGRGGVKSLCHESWRPSARRDANAMAPDSDRLVGLLADRVSPILTPPSPRRARPRRARAKRSSTP